MSMKRSIAGAVAGVLLTAMLGAMAQATSCEPMLKPTSLQAPNVAQAFHAWMCSTRFVSHREFIDAGAAEGVEAYGQRLTPGALFTHAERDAWKAAHCSAALVGARPAEAARSLFSTLPAADVQGFAACRNSSTSHLACAIVPGVRGATLTVRWNGGESRPAGIRPKVLLIDVAGGTTQSVATTSAGVSTPDATRVADIQLTTEPCASVAAGVETTFGFCAVAPYVPGVKRRDETRMFDKNAQGIPYEEVKPFPTKNLGFLVRHLQIETKTVELTDRSGEITGVSYSCRNPVAFDRCPYSRNPDTEDTTANVVVAPDKKSFTWKRLWSGDPVDDIYTVRFQVPRAVCVEHCECPAR